jgi:hypothetical protein
MLLFDRSKQTIIAQANGQSDETFGRPALIHFSTMIPEIAPYELLPLAMSRGPTAGRRLGMPHASPLPALLLLYTVFHRTLLICNSYFGRNACVLSEQPLDRHYDNFFGLEVFSVRNETFVVPSRCSTNAIVMILLLT